MKQITLNIFKFNELSAEAKKTAINNTRESISSSRDECDCSDYSSTLKRIEDVFGIKVNYDVSCCGHSFRFSIEDERWDNMADEPRFLLRYLNAVALPGTAKGNYYSTTGHYINGKYHYKHRYSKVLFSERSCCLTGCWCDNGIDDAVNAAYDAVRKGWTIRIFIEDALSRFFKLWEDDLYYDWSDECVEEELTEGYREREFLENGKEFTYAVA